MRKRDADLQTLVLAWHVANYGMAGFNGSLPNLKDVIRRFGISADRLTPAAQRTQVALLSEYMGVEMQPLSDAARQALLRLNKES